LLEPCNCKTASWAVDDPEQVALIFAQYGTTAWLGGEVELGEASGDGLGFGVGVGVGVELATGEREGLGWTAADAWPQPARVSSAARAATPSLTAS
jgi:hypothetical protein